jgi:biopolymer transport protein ExbB/TolQ
MGTIFGLITSFRGVADADPAKKATILSEGISEALNCTAFGLLVAIIAIVAFGFFQMKIGKITNDLLESSMKIMNMVCSNRDKVKY